MTNNTDTAPQPTRRTRGGGRSARREQRETTPGAGQGAAYPAILKREIPTYELLSEEGLDKVEQTAEDIMQEVGMEIWGDEELLQMWKDAGADVTGEKVRFPKGLVRKLCETAPAEFKQHARNPDRTVIIGGDHIVFAPAYGSPFVRDMDGGRRYGTIEDFQNLVKLAYMSPQMHHSGGTICEPVDVPVNKRHLDMVYAHLRLSDKPLFGSITSKERAADSIEMCKLVFGAEKMENDCVIIGNINVNSPLVFDGEVTKVMRTYAAANQGMIVAPFILGGAMGPVTTAGAVAQSFAEALVGVAITQLQRPGAPAIMGNFLSSMALRSGARRRSAHPSRLWVHSWLGN